jgi:hypothetical protein
MQNQTPNIGEQWRYVWEGEESKFTLYTVDVDADDEGRTKDFGQEIASGYWEGGEEGLWALTATPVMLHALQAAQEWITQGYGTQAQYERVKHWIERAIKEATTDPNKLEPNDAGY